VTGRAAGWAWSDQEIEMGPVATMMVVVAGMLVLGALGEFIFARTGVPDVVWLVAAGILAGPVFEWVQPKLLTPAIPYFGAIALTVILSGGAFRLRLAEVTAMAPRGILLGLLGFAFSVLAISLFFWIATGLGWVRVASPLTWILVGAILGGTSSVIIIPTVAKGSVPAGVASMLEVESAATDALSVVIAMVIIDYLVSGVADASRPIVTLIRQLGLGLLLGVVGAALLLPLVPPLRDRPHGYTVFLASMLALYGIAESLKGNGAMAVLTGSLLLGNASSVVPRLFPGAKGHVFTTTETSTVMQDQMSFLIKSFFFFLIGLMFPMDPRQIGLAAAATIFLLLFRLPAVKLAAQGQRLDKKGFWLLGVAMPRGLAAGVLATLPVHYGIAGAETLSSAIFALIVFSVLFFAAGVGIVSRFPDEQTRVASGAET
jgi:cell volume regulation protein A